MKNYGQSLRKKWDYNKRANIPVITSLERKRKNGVDVKYMQGNHDQTFPNFMKYTDSQIQE